MAQALVLPAPGLDECGHERAVSVPAEVLGLIVHLFVMILVNEPDNEAVFGLVVEVEISLHSPLATADIGHCGFHAGMPGCQGPRVAIRSVGAHTSIQRGVRVAAHRAI